MDTRFFPLLPTALAAVMLAGCGGGGAATGGGGSAGPGGGAIPNMSGGGGSSGSLAGSSVAMRIVVPASTTASASARRSPQYLPANVASMTIVISVGATPYATHTIQLGLNDPGCSSTLPVTCSATFPVPIGNDTFALTSADAANNPISHAIVTHAIVAGPNALPVTLNGIVHSIAIIPGYPDHAIYEGATSKGLTQTGNITALDVDGNTIVGVFDSPLTITADGQLFSVAGGQATVATSADTFQYGYNLPDPYTHTATFLAGTTYLAQPTIDNAKTLVAESKQGAIALWYDFGDSDASMFTAAAGHVSGWKDRNGSVNAVTQVLASAQPSVVTGGFTHNPNQNTLQNVSFGAGQCLVSAAGFPSGDYTLFAVGIGTAAPGTLVGPFGTPATYAHSLSVPSAGEIQLSDQGGAGPNLSALTLTTPDSYYVSATVASATKAGTLWFHGFPNSGPMTANFAAATGSRDPGLALNGASGLCAGAAANALGEVIILDHVASTNERLSIEEYLHRKWDI